ncbi:MAG: hypothetical protein E6K80_01015, partial [Candidatus Eisenbacteria bacterium]
MLALASAPRAFGQVAPRAIAQVRAIAWGAPDSLQLQLLDVRIERRLLGVTLEAYQSGSRTWVPLRALAEVLGLPITVDRMAGQADGQALGRTPPFHVDLETGRVRVGERDDRLQPGQVRRGDRDLLVEVQTLAAWLPAELS